MAHRFTAVSLQLGQAELASRAAAAVARQLGMRLDQPTARLPS